LGIFSRDASLLIPVILCSWLLIGIEDIRAQDSDIANITGETIYRLYCLRCHGTKGDGGGPDSYSLIVSPGDFHSPESTAKSEIELRTIIIWGIVFSPMHGWWNRLTSEEIRAVIDYIRELAPYQPRI
jgi:mono/diheme cytochrome c family protein